MSIRSFLAHLLDMTLTDSPKDSRQNPRRKVTKQQMPHPQKSASEDILTDSNKDVETISPDEVMAALGVEVLEDGGDGFYLVGFQGGVFVFNFAKGCLTAMYNDIAECTFTEASQAVMIANEINGEYSVWSCYLRTNTNEKVEKPVRVCLSQLFSLTSPISCRTEFIRSVLMNAFTVARDFRDRLKEALKQDVSMSGVLNDKDFVHKLNLAKRMMEVGNWDEVRDERPSNDDLRVESLAALFNDSEFGSAQSMHIWVDDQVEKVTNPKSVIDFNIRDYIRNYPDNENLRQINILVTFDKQDLVISLRRMPGSSTKSFFYAMNIMRSGVDSDRFTRNHSTVSCRATVEVRLTTLQEDYWEVKYMVDEAKEKKAKDRISELTNEQKMLLVETLPNVQEDLYWGMKFFNQNCLFQSLYYFKRLYHNFVKIESKTEKDMSFISEVSLYIGMIYSQLKMHDRAFYYFDRARGLESIFSAECMINCMCNLKDSYVINYIQKMMEVVVKRLKEEENPTQYYEFYLFLKRNLVNALIFERRLNEVTDYLQQMIENGEELDFAHEKLDEITRIKLAAQNKEAKTENKTENHDETDTH